MIALLRRAWLRYLDRHDPAWKATGVRQVYSGHDAKKSREGYLKAQGQTETGRKLAKPRAQKPATVTPMRRKQA